PQGYNVVNSNGDALATWNASGGATHYTITYIERYEQYDNWVGTYNFQEYRGGPITLYGNSTVLGTYTGNSTCVTFDNMYNTDQTVYEVEIQAHFPDGITGNVGRYWNPTGPC
ncbi:MAG TPA: hypothetical protein VK358_05655, partial [Longimicrobium sp.]|nr:hypothetical protein [Longimicrobium sp.]